MADGRVSFLICTPQLPSCQTLWLSCEEHHHAQWLVGGCLEVEWKLFVEYVMRIMYVCSSPGDWLSLASREDATSFLSHFGFLKHRRALPPPNGEIRIYPSPLHPLHQIELTDSSHNILEIIINSGCLFKLLLDFLSREKQRFQTKLQAQIIPPPLLQTVLDF